jgi:hypothetical protein
VRELAAGAGHDEALAAGLLAAAERAEAERGRRAWRDAWQAADRKRLRAWL